MATVTRTCVVDDLDGSTEDVENVQFSLDGRTFEIDLSAENAARLREKLERFIEAGHQVKEQRPNRDIRQQVIAAGVVSTAQTQAIRHWAKDNGYQVSERGPYTRLPPRGIRSGPLTRVTSTASADRTPPRGAMICERVQDRVRAADVPSPPFPSFGQPSPTAESPIRPRAIVVDVHD